VIYATSYSRWCLSALALVSACTRQQSITPNSLNPMLRLCLLRTLAAPTDSAAVVSRPSDLSAGKLVQSPEGKAIGTVQDIVPDPNTGQPAYVLIATSSRATAIPYWAISHLLRDAHLVIDRSLLTSAPRVRDEQVRNSADVTWKKQADRYWHAYR
jgi:hypothetical protein